MSSEATQTAAQDAPIRAVFEATHNPDNPFELWEQTYNLAFDFEEYLAEHAPQDLNEYIRASDSIADTLGPFIHATTRINILDSVSHPDDYDDEFDSTVGSQQFNAMHLYALNGILLRSISEKKHVQSIFSEDDGRKHTEHSVKNIFGDTLNDRQSPPAAIGVLGEQNGVQLIIDAIVNGKSISFKNINAAITENWAVEMDHKPLHDLLSRTITTPVTEYKALYQDMLDRTEDGDMRTAVAQSIAIYEVLTALTATGNYLRLKSKERTSLRSNIEILHSLLEKHDGFNIDKPSETEQDVLTNYSGLKPMEVDWTILPPGELGEAARTIVRQLEERGEEDVVIDLERLRALDLVREKWGKDASYYVVGSLKNRPVTPEKDEETEESPEDYIMLILQDITSDGKVIGEHSVAESPVVGRHATYVFRYDVDDLSWRDIMSMSKKDARYFNARQVKHTKTQGILTPEITAQKIDTLLSCDTTLFVEGEFRSPNKMRIRKRIAETALSQAAKVA